MRYNPLSHTHLGICRAHGARWRLGRMAAEHGVVSPHRRVHIAGKDLSDTWLIGSESELHEGPRRSEAADKWVL